MLRQEHFCLHNSTVASYSTGMTKQRRLRAGAFKNISAILLIYCYKYIFYREEDSISLMQSSGLSVVM